ncbi:hypothetical protein LB467_15530 [Salegentibacter sp. JZCK2]|uniref:hypothetical protein n=1 Tax=Salegentibacter tibetensis TaxID=2873600 RepID=UPI001CCEFECE|nr:hypothetical protein [Salegentibacter tibetensis]MBZ9731106.1 hypothetical protein [Salegentibacter tibetensis]
MKNKQRKKDLKTARKIQTYNIVYDIIEVGVSLTAGFTSGSSALIGWGLDSVVEVLSASTLWWRFNGEINGIEK